MIRLDDQQAEQLAGLFEHLGEVLSLMNAFVDDASAGRVDPDRAAQLRGGSASLRETAAQVAEMLADRSKRKRIDRPWANRGGAVKFGGLGAPPTVDISRKARGAGKKAPASGS